MTFDFNQLADDIASTSADANTPQAGGGDYEPPAEGTAHARFIGYVEVGQHFRKGNPGKRIPDKNVDQAWLIFELSGPKHKPKELEDGTKIPHRVTVKLTKSLSEKAWYFKVFKRMNYESKYKHFAQMLGQAFLVTVRHSKWKDDQGKERTSVYLDDDTGYTIRPPRREVYDEDTGDTTIVPVNVAEAISEIRVFVWNPPSAAALKQMWDSLFIAKREGQDYDPNVFQNTIKKAVNLKGSPIGDYLEANGVADIPEPTKASDLGLDDDTPAAPGKADADDPLQGL